MIFFVLFTIILAFLIKYIFFPKKIESIEKKHIVITGGSSGIGKAVAILAAKKGAHVTILARNITKLSSAAVEIRQACIDSDQMVQIFPVDVTNYSTVQNVLNEIEQSVAPIFMLVNCAGMAICGKLEDMSFEQIKNIMDINFFGTVAATKAVVQKFKERKQGIIVITASQAALVGIFGMSAYTGSKFALRGFAEALDMEVHGHNVGVTLVLPPDTDTPGFENENKSKPIETTLICESAGLFKPEDVAKKLLDDALKRKFFSCLGFESFITSTLCVGMTRSFSVIETIFQVLVLGLLRVVGLVYLSTFHSIIKRFILEH